MVLVSALDASQREVRDLALTALLARRNATAELNVLRRSAEAVPHLQHALQLQPNFPGAHNTSFFLLLFSTRAKTNSKSDKRFR